MRNPMMRSLLLPAMCALLFTTAVPAAAQPRRHVIDIFRPEKVVHPIAIPEFQADGPGDASFATALPDIIGRDLEFTGLFRVLDRGSYLEAKGSVKPNGQNTKWDDWTVLKASVLVRGGYRAEAGGRATAKIWVFSVADGSKLGELQVTDTRDRLAHRLADGVYKLLTGEDSIFSTQLAFVNNRTGAKEIWTASFDGRGEMQITRNRSINLAPSWSPDGKRLIFTSYVRNHPDLYFYDRPKDKFFRVSDRAGINIGGAWAPQGRVLAVTLSDRGNSDIYLMGEDGKGAKKITDHFGLDVQPTWAPDGRSIAFSSDRGGMPNIYVAGVDGSNPKRLTFEGNGNGKDNQAPSWSPRGDRIAFQSRVGGTWQIFHMKPDGSGVRQITSAGNNEDPTWSPDGRMLAFVRDGKLWVMEADGTNARMIGATAGSFSNVVWSPRIAW